MRRRPGRRHCCITVGDFARGRYGSPALVVAPRPGDWPRRERRRRLVLAVLIAVVFTLATLIHLWVLYQTPTHPGVIFSGAQATASG